jgi:ribosomal protein S18 acetylase RimI-like enzyme
MPIIFTDNSDDIKFEYHDTVPETMVKRTKQKSAPQLNITLLQLYGLYRNTIYDSYKEKSDLAKDIKEYKKIFQEKAERLITDPLYHEPLYHYSVAGSLDAMKSWKESANKMKCYIAYRMENGHKRKFGFVHFIEKMVNDKPIIYIASAGVSQQGKGIGRRLMECVLAHYPAKTDFNIVTRVFNTEAINLYHRRLHFQPIGKQEVEQLGYDDRYCGFKHTTTESEVSMLKSKQVYITAVSSISKTAKSDKKDKGWATKGVLLGAAAITFGFVAFRVLTRPNNACTEKISTSKFLST